MEQERLYLEALESARTVAVRGGRLEMRHAAGAIAVTLVRA